MVGSMEEMVKERITNMCVDGKCSGCGECCSAILPLSDKEVRNIERYIRKKHIQVNKRIVPTVNMPIDLTCPFLDYGKEKDKCKIYPVRPEICKSFICCEPIMTIEKAKRLYHETRSVYYMWDLV